jgi:hypothetical protein
MLAAHMPGIKTRSVYHLYSPTAESSNIQRNALYAGTKYAPFAMEIQKYKV